ncbi:MAG: endospore germination permease [Bacilli bacterium]|nr:endospore germination permease [Bacilli bacterium]
MEKKNNYISALQYSIIALLMSNSLFVGLGTMIILNISKQDSWITVGAAGLVGLIPILLLIYIINYHPALNIFNKNTKLFGSFLGNIINVMMIILVFITLTINIWDLSNYASTKYLSETPIIFVTIIFIIPIIYACYKGIETIGRTSEILVFLGLILFAFIIWSLLGYSEFDNIKPILVNGINPIIEGGIRYISYIMIPFFLLSVIPKNDIVDNKNTTKYLISSYLLSILSMFIVLYMSISVLGIDIASLYRYTEYYLMKKIEIFGVLENLENFFAIHWIFNMFTLNTMTVYFIMTYFIGIFKVKKDKPKLIIILIIASLSVISSLYIFKNSTTAVHFMKNQYPILVALPIFIIIVISTFLISIKKKAK